MYKIKQINKIKVNNPILIEGLPGIGNVGKIAADFIIDDLKAKKIIQIHSYNFPHAVFVNEDNLVELPTIEIFHVKNKKNDLLILAGDIQPIDESSCYEFCDKILDIFQEFSGSEVITTGGIGLQEIPKNPKVYCTANNKKILKRYKSRSLHNNIYGVVGPIIGVSGLLVGLSKQRKIPAISFLAETYGHPTYLGIKGAKEILKILNSTLNLKLNFKKLDKEILELEKELKPKVKAMDELSKLPKKKGKFDVDYIG